MFSKLERLVLYTETVGLDAANFFVSIKNLKELAKCFQ